VSGSAGSAPPDLNRLRNSAKLDAWIANAKASLVSSFATGVLRDIAAVRAAITQPWSNSQVEGKLRTSHSSNDKCMGANMCHSQFCMQNDGYHIEVNW
jgi:transposase